MMFNIWVMAAVYDVCMHVLMEQVKPYLQGEYLCGVLTSDAGPFCSVLVLEDCIFTPYNDEVVVMESSEGGGVTVIIYSADDYPLVLHNQGEEYEEVYRTLYH